MGSRYKGIGPSHQWSTIRNSIWDELQQKECKSVNEFNKKANKFLKLENSKEALQKAWEASTSKKGDQGEKGEKKKENEKKKAEEKRGNNRRNREVFW